jgi:hypothetical protein
MQEVVSRPKELEGLGITDLHRFGMALRAMLVGSICLRGRHEGALEDLYSTESEIFLLASSPWSALDSK